MAFFGAVLVDVLRSLYVYTFASAIMAFLCMFAYKLLKENGIKKTLLLWIKSFKTNREFRLGAILFFFLFMVLFRTILARDFWAYPLRNVIGEWGIFTSKGKLYTENIENFILLMPLALVYLNWRECAYKTEKVTIGIIWSTGLKALIFSLIIEFAQLFLQVGLFQLTDVVHNTAGGFAGGVIYYIIYRIKHKGENQ